MSVLNGKRAVVTGGGGFLGRQLVDALRQIKGSDVVNVRSADYDLRDRVECRRLMQETKPAIVFHLAARVGGIGINSKRPGLFFFENAVMGIETMEAARLAHIEKFISIGTACSYPRLAAVPFKESEMWSGYPDKDGAPYGMAKKMLIVQSMAYRDEYGFNSISLIPTNLYGPGDNFDPTTSHVMPSLVRRFTEAKERGESEVVVWGTGNASREFLHVDDAVRGILLAAERYDLSEPVNLGSGREVPMRELAEIIRRVVGFEGRIQWDASQPEGQPRRQLDTSRAKHEFGFEAQIPLEKGVEEMVAWYRENRHTMARPVP